VEFTLLWAALTAVAFVWAGALPLITTPNLNPTAHRKPPITGIMYGF